MTATYPCVLFDLDGTIVDSGPAITRTIAAALEQLGYQALHDDQLRAMVGPPLLESFQEIAGQTPEQAADTVAKYRLLYLAEGILDGPPFAGMPELLSELQEAGVTLALTTSKPETSAVLILQHFGLDRYFTVMAGADEHVGRTTKAAVVRDALERLDALGVDRSSLVLVGDRVHDVEGGTAHGIPVIRVRWGYGEDSEDAGAVAVAHSVSELRALLLP